MRHALIHRALTLALLPALAAAAPPEVPVSQPVVREVADQEDFTGRAEASTTVEVRARVAGHLEKVLFKEGTEVKKGDALFQLDDRPYRAELEKALAEVARTEARLKQADTDHRRATKLLEVKGISREEFDRVTATLEEARAVLQVARASLDLAKLNLEYTRIISPIDGKVGKALVDAGNLVKADAGKDSVLATVIVLDPLHVSFNVDEKTLARLQRLVRERRDREGKVMVGVGLTGQEGYPQQAAVDFIDNRVDAETGTVRVRTVLPNPKGEVLPGQLVRVRLSLGAARKTLLVPDAAIARRGARAHVLVVNDKNILEERPVKPGPLAGGLRMIEEGLGPDDWVVGDGPRGLKAGDEVKPRREKTPPGAPREEGLRPGGAGGRPSLPDFPGAGPAVVVTATYPGANARTVEETVAVPIEKQLDGLEGVVHRILVCTDEGEMRLTLTFKKGTDLDTAMVLAQNRVAVAEPTLPEEVKRLGVRLKKRPTFLLGLALLSPDGSRNREFLGEFADKLRDELARVPAIADVTFYGEPGPSPQLQISLDREKMAARGLTAAEVARALQEQNVELPAGYIGRPPLATPGRLQDPAKLGDVIVKAGKDGGIVRLKDVARVEQVSGWSTITGLDGKPCVFLHVYRSAGADPRDTAKAVQARLKELAKKFPAGIDYRVIEGDQ